jgi:hypothetical protein
MYACSNEVGFFAVFLKSYHPTYVHISFAGFDLTTHNAANRYDTTRPRRQDSKEVNIKLTLKGEPLTLGVKLVPFCSPIRSSLEVSLPQV